MHAVDFVADTLPVVELTDTGCWVALGEVHDVALSRVRRGKGCMWIGAYKTLTLMDDTLHVRVLRWQPDKLIVERMTVDG